MSSCYLDTSAFAKIYISEPGSDEIIRLIQSQYYDRLMILS